MRIKNSVIASHARKVVFFVMLIFCWEPMSSAMAATSASEPVVRLANGEWPPYTGARLPHQGCDSQVVTEAFALEGIKVVYEFFPWARGYMLSQNGVLDGAIDWADTAEHRAAHFVSKDYISRQLWVFFHRTETNIAWDNLHDLRGKTIGLTIGYAYSDAFKALKAANPALFPEAASDSLNLKKLLSGRIDLFPIERAVGLYLIRTELSGDEQAQLSDHPKPVANLYTHLLLSRTNPGNEQRILQFDRGLHQLKANGRYKQIMQSCSSHPLP